MDIICGLFVACVTIIGVTGFGGVGSLALFALVSGEIDPYGSMSDDEARRIKLNGSLLAAAVWIVCYSVASIIGIYGFRYVAKFLNL